MKKEINDIYDYLHESSIHFMQSALRFQLTLNAVENIKNSHAVYKNYSPQEKKKIENFLKYINSTTANINHTLNEILEIVNSLKK